jgi:hypothetical protein
MDRVTDTVLEPLTATDTDVPLNSVTVIVEPFMEATVPCTTVPPTPPAAPAPPRLPPAPKVRPGAPVAAWVPESVIRVAVRAGEVPEAKIVTWSPELMSLNDPAVVLDTVVEAEVVTVTAVPV